MDKLKDNRKLMEMVELLTAPHSHQETVEIIVSKAAEVVRADRVCLISRTKDGKLRVEDGFPRIAHIVGVDLLPETGEIFLSEVLANKTYELVEDLSDSRVSYLRSLVGQWGITSLLAVPLYHEDNPLGLLVFDFVQGHRIDEEARGNVHFLSHIAAMALWKEQNRQEGRAKENLYLLGESLMQTLHDLGHVVQDISFSIGLANECLTKRKYLSSPRLQKTKAYLEMASLRAGDLVRFVNDIKVFAKPRKMKSEKTDLNEFLAEVAASLHVYSLDIKLDLDIQPHTALIDRAYMKVVLCDLCENAVHAGAHIVVFRTRLKEEEKEVEIFISNDGDKIAQSEAGKLFDLWYTTKEQGTGMGLANVRTIIEKFHGGNIKVCIEPETTFIITLPIM